MLVALFELEQAARSSQTGPYLCPKGTLIREAGRRCCEQRFKELDAHLQVDKPADVRCPAFQQMNELLNQGLVKQRQRKGLCPSGDVFELQELGRTHVRSGRGKEDCAALATLLTTGRGRAGLSAPAVAAKRLRGWPAALLLRIGSRVAGVRSRL